MFPRSGDCNYDVTPFTAIATDVDPAVAGVPTSPEAVRNVLLYCLAIAEYTLRVFILNHGDLRFRVMYESNNSPGGGHRGRDKTYLKVRRAFLLEGLYLQICKRLKSIPSLRVPVQYLTVPAE